METNEKRFESDIERYMLNQGGYIKGNQDNSYERGKAIDMSKLTRFISETQPAQWKKFIENHPDPSGNLYRILDDAINKKGLLHVLRYGIEDRGVKLGIAAFKPETSINKSVVTDYDANILECIRQFGYSTKNTNTIDMVIMLNGIPIVALELKNQFTGQTVYDARKQYMRDRDPEELCFHFNCRFLVYFAVDLREVYMTTQLKKDKTVFLPFNQGSNGAGNVGGKGNPANSDGYPTSYLWQNVLKKDTLMEIIQRYMKVETKKQKDYRTGNLVETQELIFPRYHQLDVVAKIMDDVKLNGSGKSYLVEHSAGSGKSNSIAWLTYGLCVLHDRSDNKIFKSVIVVTDRKVLDSQLQNTIFSFDHPDGLVERIDDRKRSKGLRDAINNGKLVIVTTLQKFPQIYKEVVSAKGENYAVIIDEAHSSQTGTSAIKLKSALIDTEAAIKEYAKKEHKTSSEIEDGMDEVMAAILKQGKADNISYFAFTATPKKDTLELFGTKRADGSYGPFHVYSMRQAIEEGFILDVLKNYMTYKAYFKIIKATSENPDVPLPNAMRQILEYQSLHPYSIREKTKIMVETIRESTKKKIYGHAKAMVVTSGRLQAICYYREFKRYIKENNYDDINILIAFSDSLFATDESGRMVEYKEENMNVRPDGTKIKEKQLPEEFKDDRYSVLIVADKYQTGYDEPLLHTMFVDKKLDGIKAVQTLSRLNRTCSGKTDTLVIDFVNSIDDIKKAFEPYYGAVELDEGFDPKLVYKTRDELRGILHYTDKDVVEFYDVFIKNVNSVDGMGKIASKLIPTADKYLLLGKDDKRACRKLIRNFVRMYEYVTQISHIYDREFYMEHIFCVYLEKMIPHEDNTQNIDLTEYIQLEFYKLEQTFNGSIPLDLTSDSTVMSYSEDSYTNIGQFNESMSLENVIERVNERYGGEFTEDHKVILDALYDRCVIRKDKKLQMQARQNDENVFKKSIFPAFFQKVAYECFMESEEKFGRLLKDSNFYNLAEETLAEATYNALKSA